MATYILNILPSKLLDHHSPTEILYKRAPTYTHLRVFGCLCYPLIPSTKINKLQPRSSPCVFLGYPQNHRGYKCYDLATNNVILSRHVIFDESQFPFANLHTPTPPTYHFLNHGVHPLIVPFISTLNPKETNTTRSDLEPHLAQTTSPPQPTSPTTNHQPTSLPNHTTPPCSPVPINQPTSPPQTGPNPSPIRPSSQSTLINSPQRPIF
ncbi:retrovirus-related pol polyprotein from transposon TNT 1-94 [Tanacetum coccineum]